MSRWSVGWRYWSLSLLPPIVGGVIAVYLTLQIRVSHDRGRDEAIDRYRKECVHPTKNVYRYQVTLLYIDEYRAGNCEEAIRFIWGDGAVMPFLGTGRDQPVVLPKESGVEYPYHRAP